MSEHKAPRVPAGDAGTSDRIEGEAGHYWVRLVTRQAIRREGEAMQNCLRDGRYDELRGSEDATDDGLWSVRNGTGLSIALAEVRKPERQHLVTSFLGFKNSIAPAAAYRQLSYLAAEFESFGSKLHLDDIRAEPVVVAPSGETYRWDKAPACLRLHDHDERMERRRQGDERRAAHRDRIEGVPPIPLVGLTEIRHALAEALKGRTNSGISVAEFAAMVAQVQSGGITIEEWIERNLGRTAGQPDGLDPDSMIGFYGHGPGQQPPPQPGEPIEVREWEPVALTGFVRYDPATSYLGILPDGLLYSTALGSPDSGQTRIVTAFDGREVTAFEVHSNGRVSLEFAPRQMVEIRSNELPGRPVIASYPVPAGPGGDLEARIVTDNRVDDWRGAAP